MGSRIPSHQLSNGLYVSGRPEHHKERQPTIVSRAIPYTGGDVKKSGELGKMFDIPVSDHPPPLLKSHRASSSSQHSSGSFKSDPDSDFGPIPKRTPSPINARGNGEQQEDEHKQADEDEDEDEYEDEDVRLDEGDDIKIVVQRRVCRTPPQRHLRPSNTTTGHRWPPNTMTASSRTTKHPNLYLRSPNTTRSTSSATNALIDLRIDGEGEVFFDLKWREDVA